jgi:hypothetical protein
MAGSDLFTGTLDILILKAVAWGPNHGYGIGRWSPGDRTTGTASAAGFVRRPRKP